MFGSTQINVSTQTYPTTTRRACLVACCISTRTLSELRVGRATSHFMTQDRRCRWVHCMPHVLLRHAPLDSIIGSSWQCQGFDVDLQRRLFFVCDRCPPSRCGSELSRRLSRHQFQHNATVTVSPSDGLLLLWPACQQPTRARAHGARQVCACST